MLNHIKPNKSVAVGNPGTFSHTLLASRLDASKFHVRLSLSYVMIDVCVQIMTDGQWWHKLLRQNDGCYRVPSQLQQPSAIISGPSREMPQLINDLHYVLLIRFLICLAESRQSLRQPDHLWRWRGSRSVTSRLAEHDGSLDIQLYVVSCDVTTVGSL